MTCRHGTWNKLTPDDIADAQFRATQAAILEDKVRSILLQKGSGRRKSVNKYALVLILLQVFHHCDLLTSFP
jgi:hypothetical protein